MVWYSEGIDPSFPPPPPALAAIQFIEQPNGQANQSTNSNVYQRPIKQSVSTSNLVKPSELSYTQPLLIPLSDYKTSQYARPSTLPYNSSQNRIQEASITKTSDVKRRNTRNSRLHNSNLLPDIQALSLSQPNLRAWNEENLSTTGGYISSQNSVKSEYIPRRNIHRTHGSNVPISKKHRKASKSQGTLLYNNQAPVMDNGTLSPGVTPWDKPHFYHHVVYEPKIGIQHEPFHPKNKNRRTKKVVDSDMESDYNSYPPPRNLIPMNPNNINQQPSLYHNNYDPPTPILKHHQSTVSIGPTKTVIDIINDKQMNINDHSNINGHQNVSRKESIYSTNSSINSSVLNGSTCGQTSVAGSEGIQVLTPCNQGYFHHHNHGYSPFTPPGSDISGSTGRSQHVRRASSSISSNPSQNITILDLNDNNSVCDNSSVRSHVSRQHPTVIDGQQHSSSVVQTNPLVIYTSPASSDPANAIVMYTPPDSVTNSNPGSAPYTPPASAPQTPLPSTGLNSTEGIRKGSNRRRRINSKYKVRNY